MTHTPPGLGGEDFGGSIAYGKDGKLYIQSGKTAFWNLEVTGLDTVRALPGGSLTLTAPEAAQAEALRGKRAAGRQRPASLRHPQDDAEVNWQRGIRF